MDERWLLTLIPLLALTANVIMQIISIHFFSRVKLSIIIGLLAGFVTELYLLIRIQDLITTLDVCVSVLTYTTLSICFWAFLNLNITSVMNT